MARSIAIRRHNVGRKTDVDLSPPWPGVVPSDVHVAPRRTIAASDAMWHHSAMQGDWLYIMTNRPNGALYVGVTSDLARRAWEHREGAVDGFTKRDGLKRLVYVERYDDIRLAIQREKNMKHWPRTWKVRLILASNPRWDDLFDQLA